MTQETAPDLLAKLDQIPRLALQPRTVEELSGGLTNHNLKITNAGGSFVARCFQSDSELLGIDRDHEHANTRAAAQAGVGAPVLDYRPDLGVMVIGYLDGRTYDNESFQEPGVLPRVADAMRRLHTGPEFAGVFDMFARQHGYLRVVRDRGFALPAHYADYDEQFQQIRAALEATPSSAVPCNNDLLAGNFVDDGDTLWLIDYEYAGTNDPCFELGNTATECGLSDDQLAELVTAYYGETLTHKLARVRLQRIVSQYGWALWGYIQAATSPLEFDFGHWGDERFEGAAREFADPAFARLLDEVHEVD